MTRKRRTVKQAKQLPAWQSKEIARYVRDFKCPECKAYALYVDERNDTWTVRCRKCGYSLPLAEFARTVMSYAEHADHVSILVPDLLGKLKEITITEE